ncbi:MAG TPA: MmgE/PrpD family protein [Pseudonocardiaceae bacterium]|jgi:2-methylcitrate dehydratase PrpD|nr:MmgE/PrpD family protein [Pseudonocardiaceae bacterium]
MSTALAVQLAEFAVGARFDRLPTEVGTSVVERVLDSVGVSLGAFPLDTSQAAIAVVRSRGGTAQARVIGSGDRLPAASAAFANGVLAHSLDYDDTHLPSILHPSASIVPGALAAAQLFGRSGAEFLTAVAVGLEVCVRLGMSGYDEKTNSNVFFDRGQHATSICGTIGAAVAAAKLSGADAGGICDAIGISASMAAGIIEANRGGGTVKRLHCGWAAQSGVSAAELTAHGFTGPDTVLEGRFGLLNAFLGEHADLRVVTADLGGHWHVPDIFVKPYPANHFTHTVVDAAAELARRGVRPVDIVSVEVGVPDAIVRTIGEPIEVKRAPQTGYQAQFSGPYAVTVGLLGGHGLGAALVDYTDELAQDAERRAIMRRVTVVADATCDEVYPHQFPAVLTAELTDGTRQVSEVMVNRGGRLRPLSRPELETKFTDNATRVLTEGQVTGALAEIRRLPEAATVDALLAAVSVAEESR